MGASILAKHIYNSPNNVQVLQIVSVVGINFQSHFQTSKNSFQADLVVMVMYLAKSRIYFLFTYQYAIYVPRFDLDQSRHHNWLGLAYDLHARIWYQEIGGRWCSRMFIGDYQCILLSLWKADLLAILFLYFFPL